MDDPELAIEPTTKAPFYKQKLFLATVLALFALFAVFYGYNSLSQKGPLRKEMENVHPEEVYSPFYFETFCILRHLNFIHLDPSRITPFNNIGKNIQAMLDQTDDQDSVTNFSKYLHLLGYGNLLGDQVMGCMFLLGFNHLRIFLGESGAEFDSKGGNDLIIVKRKAPNETVNLDNLALNPNINGHLKNSAPCVIAVHAKNNLYDVYLRRTKDDDWSLYRHNSDTMTHNIPSEEIKKLDASFIVYLTNPISS